MQWVGVGDGMAVCRAQPPRLRPEGGGGGGGRRQWQAVGSAAPAPGLVCPVFFEHWTSAFVSSWVGAILATCALHFAHAQRAEITYSSLHFIASLEPSFERFLTIAVEYSTLLPDWFVMQLAGSSLRCGNYVTTCTYTESRISAAQIDI